MNKIVEYLLYITSLIFFNYFFPNIIIFINKSRIFIILLQVWFLNFFLQTLLYLLTKVTCLFIYIYSSLVFNFFYPNNIMIIYFVCKQYYTLLSIIRLPFSRLLPQTDLFISINICHFYRLFTANYLYLLQSFVCHFSRLFQQTVAHSLCICILVICLLTFGIKIHYTINLY